MKTLKYGLYLLFATCIMGTMSSCDDFLEEEPLDFFSPENSMETVEHFQSSLNYLYNRVRRQVCEIDPDTRFALYYATDFAHNSTDYYKPAKLNDFANTMIPTFNVVSNIWNEEYDEISNANVILNRIEMTEKVNEENKKAIRGEAKFFRAYSYRILAHLFGGVPLVTEEITTPRRDYIRATREEVYKQCKQDLEDAIAILPNVDEVKDGKIHKQLAQHFLAEINICLKDYKGAIAVATDVINYPELHLMTDRFGSRAKEEGDVYWDLHRLDNQNRTSGNRESLWVLQYDYKNDGSATNYNMPWSIIPFYQNIMITEKNEKGEDIVANAFAGITDGKGGRGVGWIQPTPYFFNEIWSEGDIRNSEYNIIRDVKIDNPASPAVGKWFVKDGYYKQADSIRQWFPIITKFSRMNNFPEDFYLRDNNGEPLMTMFGEHLMSNNANSCLKDVYLTRLSETYLLRAEAYLLDNDKAKATEDINTVRSRAHAKPAKVEEMDMDYVLDERLRELYGEEMRMLTLCRMGKLVERNRLYNPISGKTIADHNNLWPIPFSEIERNTEAVIEQNPGY